MRGIPAQRTQVILAERDDRQWWILAMLAADPSARVRSETARLKGLRTLRRRAS